MRVHGAAFKAAWATAAGRAKDNAQEWYVGSIAEWFEGEQAAQDRWHLIYDDGEETGPDGAAGPHAKTAFLKQWLVGDWPAYDAAQRLPRAQQEADAQSDDDDEGEDSEDSSGSEDDELDSGEESGADEEEEEEEEDDGEQGRSVGGNGVITLGPHTWDVEWPEESADVLSDQLTRKGRVSRGKSPAHPEHGLHCVGPSSVGH